MMGRAVSEPPPRSFAQMRRAFQQARVNVEDVAGEGFATGRPAQQEGKLAIGAGVMREVVVNDQHVAARFHEMLRDAGRGVRSDVGETRRVVALGHDHDGVIQRALFPQDGHGLRHGGRALADGAIDAHDILAALVENGVDRNGGLARLPVAQNQLALAAPDGNERIDDLEAGLERHGDGCAVHDGRGGAFDGQALAGGHRPVAIERPAERIDDASQQSVAHGHVHDPARALDFIARVQMPVFAEQHDADFVLVHVERDAEHVAGKCHQFLEAHAGKAGDRGDAGGDAVIVPTSRGVSCGVKLSRAWPMPANARSKTRCKLSGAVLIGCCRTACGSAVDLRCRLGRDRLVQQFADALFQRREIIRDAPRHLLSVRGEFDPADQIRRGLEAERDVGREGFVERLLYRRALLRGQVERAAHERGGGRGLQGRREARLSSGRPARASGG